jgi:hypothetical protein
VVRPVFVRGAPCVTMLGTQLAPEDLIGVPELRDGRSRFAPPESIARLRSLFMIL